jgi:hypothetical protein
MLEMSCRRDSKNRRYVLEARDLKSGLRYTEFIDQRDIDNCQSRKELIAMMKELEDRLAEEVQSTLRRMRG